MKEVVEGGYVYLAKPPLFSINKGQKKQYVYDESSLDAELDTIVAERKARGVTIDENDDRTKQAGVTVSRFKGLGEMDAEQLWETTMNPENRVLIKVNVDDAERADAIFTKLMGDDVALRKNFIQSEAKNAKLEELDI